ncbi:Site-specific recombinase XerD [Pilibacter termitis]|uniref:Site-specific recombinase XerD n=1 Tax=Pilibacter termitis TaxID=263852 RepID=A0A1T4R7L1_9ENTE|nr:tyrosine recombinase XerS [Pilibacter termitis]SKA12070.1 Site-specific recombinase XerD [Pilibacter termitis]
MKREKIIQKIEEYKAIMPSFVLEYYQSKLAVPYSLSTLFEYFKEYQRFFSWMIDEGISEADKISEISLDTLEHLRKSDVERYITHLREGTLQNTFASQRGLSQATINRTITSLSSLFKYLTEEVEGLDGEPYFYRNVMKKVSTRKKSETLAARAENIKPKLFLGDETAEYLNYIDEHYEHTLNSKTRARTAFLKNKERDLALNAIILASGIRLSEAVNINVGDLNLRTRRVEVTRKGGKRDSVNIASFGIPYLERYLEVRKAKYNPEKTQKALFLTNFKGQSNRIDASSVEKMVGKYSQAFKIKVSPHKLRHTLATRLYAETNSQVLVSHQLGHASTQVTDLYTHIVDEEQRNALDKL